jgi:hypothetical protein
MKKVLLLIPVMLIGLSYADAPIYGYFWLRYTYDYLMNPDDASDHPTAFAIERGYIRWKTSTAPVAFSGTIDAAMKSGVTKESDWNIRLKYMQADWTLPYAGKYIPDAKIILGLQKVYFGLADLWEYPVLEKALEDAQKKINTADLGASFYGLIPGGFGDFAMQYFNGSGYSKPTEIDLNKAVCLNASLVPPVIVPNLGIMLKGSYWMEMTTTKYYSAADSETLSVDLDENRMAGVLQLKYAPVTLIAEYFVSQDGRTPDNSVVEGNGYSFFGEITINKSLGICGRYDMWDKNVTDTTSSALVDAVTATIAGLNWKISDALLMQFNYQLTGYEDETRQSTDKFMIQAKYSF